MNIFDRLNPVETPLVILAEGALSRHRQDNAKTAIGIIRYGAWPIVAVIDSTHAGQTVRQVTGLPCDAPIVASLEEVLSTGDKTFYEKPKALLIGIAPQGGQLPESWRPVLATAIDQGLHVINGLHYFLKEDDLLARQALENGVMLWDVRDPGQYDIEPLNPVATFKPHPDGVKVITTVGSDCSVGKMFTTLELSREAARQGWRSHFMATGQTGILVAGSGIPLDRVIGDFMAGYVESHLFEIFTKHQPSWVFVEGQGTLTHPSYSGVTLSLLHGSRPDGLILCHRAELDELVGGYGVKIPPLPELIDIYEAATSWTGVPVKVLGISLNTSAFSEEESLNMIQKTAEQTGLPVVDPVRTGVNKLLEVIQSLSPVPAAPY
ncbi:MAG: DUF1611 domain-containing protein [Vampirovibrio sp.]|nr:DUF1611 domain-containing protein [Vampirovibrio sp.]